MKILDIQNPSYHNQYLVESEKVHIERTLLQMGLDVLGPEKMVIKKFEPYMPKFQNCRSQSSICPHLKMWKHWRAKSTPYHMTRPFAFPWISQWLIPSFFKNFFHNSGGLTLRGLHWPFKNIKRKRTNPEFDIVVFCFPYMMSSMSSLSYK